jgi:HlyD family secretion protein
MSNKAYLSFGITGTVAEVLVEEGNNVTEGQVLARLDAPSLESSVEMAELQVEIAEQQVDTAQAQYDRAKEEWQAPEGWEFLEDVVKSLTGLLGQDEDTAKANLEMAELNLEMAQLNLESAELSLEKAEITAPFDGVVTDVTISEGRDVTTAMMAGPAITVISTGEMELSGFIDEIDVPAVKIGQAAIITFDALPDEEVTGEVVFVSLVSTVRAGVISYATTISLEDPVAGLRDGMSATAEVVIERRDDVLFIPNRAIRGTLENPKVVVLVGGQQEEREITLGLTDGINTEVLSGLEEGEEVVIPAAQERQDDFFMM